MPTLTDADTCVSADSGFPPLLQLSVLDEAGSAVDDQAGAPIGDGLLQATGTEVSSSLDAGVAVQATAADADASSGLDGSAALTRLGVILDQSGGELFDQGGGELYDGTDQSADSDFSQGADGGESLALLIRDTDAAGRTADGAGAPAVLGLNLVPDPGFEDGTTGPWSAGISGACTLASSTARAHSGTHSLMVTAGLNGGTPYSEIYCLVTVPGAGPYMLSAWALCPAQPAPAVAEILWYDSSFTLLGYSYSAVTAGSTWAQVVLASTAPPGAAAAELILYLSPPPSSGFVSYWDDIALTLSSGEGIDLTGVQDTGHGTDAGEALRLPGADTGHGTDAGELVLTPHSDTDAGHGTDSGFTYITSADASGLTAEAQLSGPVSAETATGTDTARTSWASDTELSVATEAGVWSGPVHDTETCGAADAGETIALADIRPYPGGEASVATDAYFPGVDIYTYVPPSVVSGEGGFQVVWQGPDGELHHILETDCMAEALRLGRVIERSASVGFPADGDLAGCSEAQQETLDVEASIGPALSMQVSLRDITRAI